MSNKTPEDIAIAKAWIADHAEEFSSEAYKAYCDEGRGFWLITPDGVDFGRNRTESAYVTQTNLNAHLPPGQRKDALARMVTQYNPRREFVVAVSYPDGGLSAYRLALITPADN